MDEMEIIQYIIETFGLIGLFLLVSGFIANKIESIADNASKVWSDAIKSTQDKTVNEELTGIIKQQNEHQNKHLQKLKELTDAISFLKVDVSNERKRFAKLENLPLNIQSVIKNETSQLQIVFEKGFRQIEKDLQKLCNSENIDSIKASLEALENRVNDAFKQTQELFIKYREKEENVGTRTNSISIDSSSTNSVSDLDNTTSNLEKNKITDTNTSN